MTGDGMCGVFIPDRVLAGWWRIPCECGKVYIGQSGRSIQLHIKDHERHVRLVQPDKSAVAKHSFNYDQMVRLQDNKILSSKTGYMNRLVSEAIEIEMHPDNINRFGGFKLSRYWKPLPQSLRERKNLPTTPQ